MEYLYTQYLTFGFKKGNIRYCTHVTMILPKIYLNSMNFMKNNASLWNYSFSIWPTIPMWMMVTYSYYHFLSFKRKWTLSSKWPSRRDIQFKQSAMLHRTHLPLATHAYHGQRCKNTSFEENCIVCMLSWSFHGFMSSEVPNNTHVPPGAWMLQNSIEM